MNRKKIFIIAGFLTLMAIGMSCGNNANKDGASAEGSGTATTTDNNAGNNAAAGNPKGIGKFQNVELTHPLDEKMVASGKNVYEVKCASCHKLTDEKLVGPGWKGVTDRRTPEWIMNFSTNVDEMIEKDPAAQKMLEECLVRMPNQNLSDDDARAVLEYMRKNDGKN
jgi:mono/diheme cytochrome c family protein